MIEGKRAVRMQLPPSLPSYMKAWTTDATVAFALLGSYARGDAGPFSDVDVVRFVSDDSHEAEVQSFLIDGKTGSFGASPSLVGEMSERDGVALLKRHPQQTLAVRSTATPSQVESWFIEPGQAVNLIAGLRDGYALWDPDGLFAGIQQRARQFQWTEELQEKANCLAAKELVGWIEEVHKGLEGLRRNDIGRLLNARFGLSWGLAWVMRLQRGVLSHSDNAFFDDVVRVVGPESRWSRLLHRAFGLSHGERSALVSLHEEVRAGLLLYCETLALLEEAIPQEEYPLIKATVQLIKEEMGGNQDAELPLPEGVVASLFDRPRYETSELAASDR